MSPRGAHQTLFPGVLLRAGHAGTHWRPSAEIPDSQRKAGMQQKVHCCVHQKTLWCVLKYIVFVIKHQINLRENTFSKQFRHRETLLEDLGMVRTPFNNLNFQMSAKSLSCKQALERVGFSVTFVCRALTQCKETCSSKTLLSDCTLSQVPLKI